MMLSSLIRRWYQRLFGVSYKHLVTVRIYRDRVIANYRYLSSVAGVPVLPVLKSNAYGHGLLTIARILDPLHPPYFVVDSYYEMMQLKKGGITSPVLIVGHTLPENVATNHFKGVVFTVLSLDELRLLASLVKTPTLLHIKIDTGLYRHGIVSHEFLEAAHLLQQNPLLIVRGLCTHYRDADSDAVFTRQQTEKFQEAVSFFSSRFATCTEFHAENSAGILQHAFAGHSFARSGIGLYGFGDAQLQPVMSIHTHIVSIKKIPQGVAIGYGGTYIAPHDMTIATIPFGYYEGLDRRLSSKGFVNVAGVLCPIVGRVSMNITTIDVSLVPHITLHESVEVISAQSDAPNSFVAHARVTDDIVYTHLVHVLEHAQRDIV